MSCNKKPNYRPIRKVTHPPPTASHIYRSHPPIYTPIIPSPHRYKSPLSNSLPPIHPSNQLNQTEPINFTPNELLQGLLISRSSTMAAEVTMILIDNSDNVPVDSDVFKSQLEAIRLYCRAKIKSNSKNRVGAATMTMGYDASDLPNLSDVEHFLTHTLEHIPWGGQYDILGGLRSSKLGFARLPEGTKRRMLVFVAGPCHGYLTGCILKIGNRLKETNVALDVVSFPFEDQEFDALKTKCLRSFVAAANNKDNSHFALVPRDSSSVCDILVSSKILSRSEVAQAEMNKAMSNDNNKKKRTRSRSRRKKNHHSQDLVEEAVSSSCRDVIFPRNLPVPPGWLVFGSLEMHQLIKV